MQLTLMCSAANHSRCVSKMRSQSLTIILCHQWCRTARTMASASDTIGYLTYVHQSSILIYGI